MLLENEYYFLLLAARLRIGKSSLVQTLLMAVKHQTIEWMVQWGFSGGSVCIFPVVIHVKLLTFASSNVQRTMIVLVKCQDFSMKEGI